MINLLDTYLIFESFRINFSIKFLFIYHVQFRETFDTSHYVYKNKKKIEVPRDLDQIRSRIENDKEELLDLETGLYGTQNDETAVTYGN